MSLYVEPSHRLPDEDWVKVVARAKEIREEIQAEAQGGAASGIAPVVDMTDFGIRSKKYFGVSGIPTQLLVLHSGECPLQGGYAKSLTEWAGRDPYPAPPIASWQWFVDPLQIVYFIPAHLGAWHASEANVLSEGFEQAGYARMSRAEWLTPDGQTQLESLAWLMAQRALANGIPARWLTTDEVNRATGGDRSVKGLCLHRQVDPDTRTDPGNGYPLDLLLERIKFYMNNVTEEDMPLSDEDARKVARFVMDFAVDQAGGLTGKMNLGQLIAEYRHNNNKIVETTSNWIKEDLAKVKALIAAQPGASVTLSEEQMDALAAKLIAVLGPTLAADLARRLAD
jgi:hypothetical protein